MGLKKLKEREYGFRKLTGVCGRHLKYTFLLVSELETSFSVSFFSYVDVLPPCMRHLHAWYQGD